MSAVLTRLALVQGRRPLCLFTSPTPMPRSL